MTEKLTGGCQCGAIRYSTRGPVTDRAICHCRMCQKAVGSVVWPFFTVDVADLEWTRGRPALYRSSEAAERGFCAACGTPISFQPVGKSAIDLSIGTLDDPAAIEPDKQYFAGQRMPWFHAMATLPEQPSSASPDEIERRRPYQHPDHDTSEWPQPGSRP
ncbi:GFA family protein [Neorhizobium alkalisoli]|uniref:CENP-V/GFA domain-containing protein n=1 Tax=Neorhizobium alkalisoli TaxID=528178 RepID=A0A561R2L0_9HYPH|nr:GFA family protein [Neorhizobium alkalisoli]TWF56852.1 hypothetical protein FHW37_102491 [Neorhizobium alkalisoli]